MLVKYAPAALVALLAGSSAAAADLRIGVVNVSEILARYRKVEDLKKEAEKKLAARQEKLALTRRELDRRIAEYNRSQDKGGEAERREVARKLEIDKFLFDLDVREHQLWQRATGDRIVGLVADEVTAVCRRIGRAEGYDLILKRSDPPGDGLGDRERLEVFRRNAVLYAADAVDMTERVLAALEDDYKKEAGAASDAADEARAPPRAPRGAVICPGASPRGAEATEEAAGEAAEEGDRG